MLAQLVGSGVDYDGATWTVVGYDLAGVTLAFHHEHQSHLDAPAPLRQSPLHVPWTLLAPNEVLPPLRAGGPTRPVARVTAGVNNGAASIAALRVVLEIETGYQWGRPVGWLPDEPLPVFDPAAGRSLDARCKAMADELLNPGRHRPDRRHLADHLRVNNGALDPTRDLNLNPLDHLQLRRLVENFHRYGTSGPRDLDTERSPGETDAAANTRALTYELLHRLGPDRSDRSTYFFIERIQQIARERGLAVLKQSQAYVVVKDVIKGTGATVAARKTRGIDQRRGGRQVLRPLVPGAIVAIDFTQADVLVAWPGYGPPRRPYVGVVIDVASQVILGVCVTRAPSAQDVSLLLYDACRPLVRLRGREDVLRLQPLPDTVTVPGRFLDGPAVEDGDVMKPGVVPAGLRVDNAPSNKTVVIQATLHALGCTLMSSRLGMSIDNGTVEAAFNALKRLWQELPNHTGANTQQRGRSAGHEPAITLRQFENRLQDHALAWWNSSVTTFRLAGSREEMTRLQAFDLMSQVYGQPPAFRTPADCGLVFNFLTQDHRTVSRRDGIRYEHSTFDSADLYSQDRRWLVNDRGQAKVWSDRRNHDRIWLFDLQTQRHVAIPNILQHMTHVPFSRELAAHAANLVRRNRALGNTPTLARTADAATRIHQEWEAGVYKDSALDFAAHAYENSQRTLADVSAATGEPGPEVKRKSLLENMRDAGLWSNDDASQNGHDW